MAPLNTRDANANANVNSFSTGVENLVDRAANVKLGDIGNVGRNLSIRVELLRGMVNKVDRPILRQMGVDMLSIMAAWLQDPEILCCLIHAIWSSYTTAMGEPERQLRIADTKFGQFLDMFITMIDLIIILLTDDIRKFSLFFPDIIKELVNGILGAILLVLQETLYALRDSVVAVIFHWLDSRDTQATWARCLPVKDLLNILKKYVHDHGLLATLFEKIKGFTSGLRMEWAANAQLPVNAKDLEFLYWLRNLLIKLKQAVLNFDFCVDYEFVAPSDSADQAQVGAQRVATADVRRTETPIFTQVADNDRTQGYTTGADGTVIVDPTAVADDNGVWISRVSNSFIREFLHKEYDLPYDAIDNTITRTTAANTVQGTQVSGTTAQAIQDLCSFTPTAKETLSWMLNIRNRMS